MNESWYAVPGLWAYVTATLAFAWLAFRLVAHWHPGGKPAMLLATAVASALASAASVAVIVRPTLALGWAVALLDFARVATTVGFLLVFLGARGRVNANENERQHGDRGWTSLMGLGLLLLAAWFLLGVRPPGLVDSSRLAGQAAYATALGVAVFGLLLVEQSYRRTPLAGRWHVRPMILGFAGLFAFDVALYSDALMFRALDFDLWSARGFAQALTIPLILATLRRRGDWSFELSLSRGVVVGSTALLIAGVYLLVVAGAGFLLREFGGSWGRALETVALFAALLLLAALVLSATFRAKVRVLVAKHFFSYRYDYREEWLRLTNTLTSGAGEHRWPTCIQAVGALVESPGGALWFRTEGEGYRQVERTNFPAAKEVLSDDDPLPRFLKETGWILDLNDVRAHPAKYESLVLPAPLAASPDAWLVVPLLTGEELVGFIVLTSPRVNVDLDWEVLDLLKTAGRQAAGYLAYARANEALLEAQKFEAFHRMSTFVVHDLKNLIAQLHLLLSNAERHRDNPDFQRDMLKTVDHAATRMQQLILQLKPEASARDRAQPVDLGAIVRRVQALRLGGPAGLSVNAPPNALVWAHDDLLERVIAHLVQNAFDASEGVPDVKVRVEAAGDEVLVEVTDQGKGMTAEFMRDRLFKPFQTTKATGMGIGVYECRQYVQQVGGRIDIQSAPGEGTRVRIHLRSVKPVQAELGAAA